MLVAAVLVAGQASAQSDTDLLDDLGAPEPADASDEGATASESNALDAPLLDEPKDAAEPEAVDEPDESDDKAKKSGAVDPRSLDRVKAVPRKAVLKSGRLELAIYPSLSLNDAYYQHYATGASLVFYPHDAFGFGLGADYFLAHDRTQHVDVLRQAMTSVPAVFEAPRLFAHADFYWVPVHGKFSLFETSILHFEMYATAGIGAASALAGRWPLAVNAGLGQRLMLGDWLAVRLEVRDHLFVDTLEVNGVPRSDIQNYLMLNLGLSVFVPPSFEYQIR